MAPRSTRTPVDGTEAANRAVLFGAAKIASETSRPTLAAVTSKAAEISMSRMWYPPTSTFANPGTGSFAGVSR